MVRPGGKVHAGESELFHELKKLTLNLGVKCTSYRGALGSHLRAAWGIEPTMDHAVMQDKVITELERMLTTLPEARTRLYLQVGFNLPSSPIAKFTAGMNYTNRTDWLNDHTGLLSSQRDKALKSAIDHATSGKTMRSYIENAIREHLVPLVGQRLAEREAEAKASGTAFSSPKSRPLIGCQSISLAFGAFALAFGSFVVYDNLHHTTPTPSPSSSTAIASADPVNLSIEVNNMTDAKGGSAAVFPSATAAGAAPYFKLNSVNVADPSPTMLQQEDVAGGYLLGGLDLNINFDTTSQDEITIYNIRPVNVKSQGIVSGALLYNPPPGGSDNTVLPMYYDMDVANRVARSYNIKTATEGAPFFATQSIGVTSTGPQPVALYFAASQGAYTFDLAVDYELDGKKYSQTFDIGGKPFAITGDLCHGSSAASTQSKSSPQLYQLARYVGASGAVHTADPATWCANISELVESP